MPTFTVSSAAAISGCAKRGRPKQIATTGKTMRFARKRDRQTFGINSQPDGRENGTLCLRGKILRIGMSAETDAGLCSFFALNKRSKACLDAEIVSAAVVVVGGWNVRITGILPERR